MIKTLNKEAIEEMYHTYMMRLIKAIYDKPIANIILNSTKQKQKTKNQLKMGGGSK